MMDAYDEFLGVCIALAIDKQKMSTSMIQRYFKVGYTRAAMIIDEMEKRGVIGPHRVDEPREVLIPKDLTPSPTPSNHPHGQINERKI